jgi:hypothetical protein
VPSVIETTRSNNNAPSEESSGNPPWGLLGLGIVVTALIGGYILTYSLSNAAAERYAAGFFLEVCPICNAGYVDLEEKHYHVLGIPRVRRAAHCENCRSVLREVGKQKWRYAVDPKVNPTLYNELNNQILTDDDLIQLAQVGYDEPTYLDEE